jgi:hypothetical protein
MCQVHTAQYYSFIDGCIGAFYIVTIVNNVAVYMKV